MTGKYDKKAFKNARRRELDCLVNNGTFIPTSTQNVPKVTRIFGSRFLDELKNCEAVLKSKYGLVTRVYNHEDATNTATKAPTISRGSQIMLIALAASIPGVKMFTRDITQLTSKENLL